MPFVENRGQRIHYEVEGSGPLVVLQHGLLVDVESWKAASFVSELSDRYTVASIDSLGHGLSDKPADPALYSQSQRAGDIVAVIDDLEVERAHLIGHSMGAWMGVGVAKHHPERLASLTIGGWNVVEGNRSLLPAGVSSLPFERFLAWSKMTSPELTAWVTPEVQPGLTACWDALQELDGAKAAVLGASAPLLMWSGRQDPYHAAMEAFAKAHAVPFLSTTGDHMGAVLTHGTESAKGIGAFLDGSSI
jgi:pimeloyl-ACP methyl ester carboxylesterase